MDRSDRQHPAHRRPGLAGEAGEMVELHICPVCGSGLVHPLDWEATDEIHWRVTLRCPDCEWRDTGLFEQAVVDRFDQVLNAGIEALQGDLRRLERMNMEADLERFSAAIGDDLILPEDF